MSFTFNTRHYVIAHGKQPRGYGSWAFDIKADGYQENNSPVFAPTGTYAQAKKWIKAYTMSLAPSNYRGHIEIIVLS